MTFKANESKIEIKTCMMHGCMMFGCCKNKNDIKKSIKHNILIKREQRKGISSQGAPRWTPEYLWL